MLQSTFNFDYKNPERGHSRSLQRKTVLPLVSTQDHDFRVCPKYLLVTSDFQDLPCPKPEVLVPAKARPRSPASGRKASPQVKAYCDSKFDFIDSYNDLKLRNKVLKREVSHLKKTIFSTQSLQSTEEDPLAALPEEPSLSLAVKPETSPRLDLQHGIKQLSPIGSSQHQSQCLLEQTPERIQAGLRQSAQTASMNFNLSHSESKQPTPDPDRLAAELASLQALLAAAHRDHAAELLRLRETSAAEARSLQQLLAQAEANRRAAEDRASQAADLLTAAQNDLDKTRRSLAEAENRWAFEKSSLSGEKDRLLKDLDDLRAELNKLKFDRSAPTRTDAQVHADLLARCTLLEGEVARLRGLELAAGLKDAEIARLSTQLRDLESLQQLKTDSEAAIQQSLRDKEAQVTALLGRLQELEEAQRHLKVSQLALPSTKFESQNNATPEKLGSSKRG